MAINYTLRFRALPVLPGILLLAALPVIGVSQPLEYTVSWMGVPVVDVTIDTSEDEHGRYTEYQAQTRTWFNRIYSVDNRYRIWVDDAHERPVRYKKWILERGNRDSLLARYDLKNPPGAIYSNGAKLPWTPKRQTFFSALVWLQHHDWELKERHVLEVEVEGVIWEVELICQSSIGDDTGDMINVVIVAHFRDRLQGKPVLATTDVLTYMLPGEGNQLQFGLDMQNDLILWAEFGSWPLLVRADLDQ